MIHSGFFFFVRRVSDENYFSELALDNTCIIVYNYTKVRLYEE